MIRMYSVFLFGPQIHIVNKRNSQDRIKRKYIKKARIGKKRRNDEKKMTNSATARSVFGKQVGLECFLQWNPSDWNRIKISSGIKMRND